MFSIPSGIYDIYHSGVDYLMNEPNIARNVTVYYEERINPVNFLEDGVTVTSENIKLRVYTSMKSWLKTAHVEFIDGRIQVIGYMTDAIKLQRSTYIMIDNNKYKLATQPVRHGFGERYFVAFLDLI